MHNSISLRKGVLYRSVVDNGYKFEAAVVPEDLIHTVLHLGHNQSGPQWISKNICCNKVCLLLEGDEKNMYWFIAKVVPHVLNKGYKKHNLKSKSSNQECSQWSSFASISLVSFTLPLQKVIDTH